MFRLGFRPNSSAMFLNNALHGGQADSGAFKLFGGVQALENSEELVGIFHIEANTVVANQNGGFVFTFDLKYFDHSGFALARELDGIGKQVHENLFQQIRIALNDRQRADSPGDVSSGQIGLQFIASDIHDFAERNALRRECLFA